MISAYGIETAVLSEIGAGLGLTSKEQEAAVKEAGGRIGGTESDETAKTFYYKFSARRPQMDQLLMGWILEFCAWREWVVTADEKTLRFVRDL